MTSIQLQIKLFLICFVNLMDANYLGGTVSWMHFRSLGGVRFTYRLTWVKGTGPCGQGCSQNNLYTQGNLPSYLVGLSWVCISGCANGSVILHDVNYIVTSVSTNSSGWEQGEGFFFYNFVGSGPFTVTLEGVPWQGTPGTSRLVTVVDLGIRNDTATNQTRALPNASPIAALQPYVGVQYSCMTKVFVPVSDPDADTIKCRLAKATECGDVCTNLPSLGFTLDEVECTVVVSATRLHGYRPDKDYQITLMVEDFPDYTIKVGSEVRSIHNPISKIPLQFTVRVIHDPRPCGYNQLLEKFVEPTREDKVRISYGGPAFGLYQNGVYLHTADITNTEFMVSVPARMEYDLLNDDYLQRSDVTRLYFNMTPWFNQSGDTMSCVWGRQHNGLTTTDKRCVTSIMYDLNNCRGHNPCFHGGICFNLYGRWTCKCPHGFKPRDCLQRVTCADFPCKNNGRCKDTGQEYICQCDIGYKGLDCEEKYNIFGKYIFKLLALLS
ncbi:uncharacterized protein [Magallana gigas]|uniref:uncharacterized protein n=1 Tax=Magallana gigas TaxID=29159 RepID=UPI003341336F